MKSDFMQSKAIRRPLSLSIGLSALGNMNAMLFLYYVSFALFLIGNCAASTTSTNELIPSFKLGCQLVAIAFLMLKLTFDRFGLKQLALFVPVSLAFGYSGYVSSDYSLLWGWLFIVTGSGAKLSDLARIALLIFGSSLLITVGLALAGAIPNPVIYRGDTPYYTYGFTHINALGLNIYEVIIALMVLRFPSYTVADYLYCIAAFLLTLIATGSRTSMLCVMVAFLMIAIVKSGFASKHERGLLRAVELLFVFEVLFSLCFLFVDPSAGGIFGVLDKLLSNRIYYAHYYAQNYGIGLFGCNLESIETLSPAGYWFSGFVIDNAYCHAILVNGLIPYLIMVALIYRCYRSMRMEGHFTSLVMTMTLFSFIGVSEASALNFYMAYALLALTPTFFGSSFNSVGGE